MIKSIPVLGFTALLALPAMASALVVTPVSGASNVAAQVTDYIDGGFDLQSNVDYWLAVPQALSASAAASVTDLAGGTITAQGDASADWFSAYDGTVTMRNFGWNYAGGAVGQVILGGAILWSYDFTPATDAGFAWTFDVQGYGDVFGLWGFQLYIDGNPIGATLDPYNPNSSGGFGVFLAGGQTHNASLLTNANIEGGGDIATYMDGDFAWSLSDWGTVPEPASWAMLITGFGLIGASLRTRRRITA